MPRRVAEYQEPSEPEVIGKFEHENPVAGSEVGGVEPIMDFVVNEVEVAPRAILPAKEEVRREPVVQVIPLDVGLNEKVGGESVKDSVAQGCGIEGTFRMVHRVVGINEVYRKIRSRVDIVG